MSALRLWLKLFACTVLLWNSDVYADSYPASGTSVPISPHEQYSSSIGVLGCKVDTNRIAYWPFEVGCDDICVKVSNEGRSLHLLRIDKSGGAYDISYDAWNILTFGKSATEDPESGGQVPMSYEFVHASECQHLLYENRLPLSAANSMNYVDLCARQPSSWVAQNFQLYNIYDSSCKLGVDEKCEIDLAASNQANCPSLLGITTEMKPTVMNAEYLTGNPVPS